STVNPGPLQPARAAGHTLAPADRDGVVRRVPLLVALGDRAVPAFGLAMAVVLADARGDSIVLGRGALTVMPRPGGGGRPLRAPVDMRGRALVAFGATTTRPVPFERVWQAIEAGGGDALQALVDDRPVL